MSSLFAAKGAQSTCKNRAATGEADQVFCALWSCQPQASVLSMAGPPNPSMLCYVLRQA